MFDYHWLRTGFPLSLLHATKSMDSGRIVIIMINSFKIFTVFGKKNLRWLLLSGYLGSWLRWQIGLVFRKTSITIQQFLAIKQLMISNLALYPYEYMWVLNTCTCAKQMATNKQLHMTETKQSRAIFNWNMLSTFILQPETGNEEMHDHRILH